MASICVVSVLGMGLLCSGGGGKAVVDRSCDLDIVRHPAMKAACLDGSGRLKAGLSNSERTACLRYAANNRTLKKRCPDKAVE